MRQKQKNDLGRLATSLLASTFVMLGGLSVCGFIILAFSDDPKNDLLWLVGGVTGLGLLLWLLRDKPTNQARMRNFFWLTRQKPETYMPNYVPRRRRGSQNAAFGSNEPPTAEGIRELNEGANTWVPKSPRNQKQPGE